jgi:hypothetical protein
LLLCRDKQTASQKKKSPRAERYEKAQERQQGQYALVAALNQVENVPENLISQTSVP